MLVPFVSKHWIVVLQVKLDCVISYFPASGLPALWRPHGRRPHAAALPARGGSGCSHHPKHHIPLLNLHQVISKNLWTWTISAVWKCFHSWMAVLHSGLWTASRTQSRPPWPGTSRRFCRPWMTWSSISNSPTLSWSTRRSRVFSAHSSDVRTSSRRR